MKDEQEAHLVRLFFNYTKQDYEYGGSLYLVFLSGKVKISFGRMTIDID